MNWLLSWFTDPFSVDSILSEFTKTIGRLEAVSVYHNEQTIFHTVEAQKHDDLALASANESARATVVAKKLKDLVG